MSTYFREIREPWSSIRVERTGKHTRITLWQDRANAGTLVVDNDSALDAVRCFAGEESCQRYAIANDKVAIRMMQHPRTRQLIDEHGDIVTLPELLEQAHVKGETQ